MKTDAVGAPTQDRQGLLTPGARRYALVVLTTIYVISFLDRQVVNILAEPIKRELHLKDAQLGLLTGLAFALFYTALALPIARLAERRNRIAIISVSLAAWSAMTAVCGLAQTFGQLLAARIGVGVGEAGSTPASHALISDMTPSASRASALAFHSLGAPIGTLLGLAFGGLVADALGWRMAFLLAGAPGVLLAVLAWTTLRDVRPAQATASSTPDVRAALRELAGKRAFWWAAMGASMSTFLSYGQTAFLGSFFLRNHAEDLKILTAGFEDLTGAAMGPTGLVGLALGLIVGASGILGTLTGGALADRAAARDASGYMPIAAAGALLGVPCFLAALFAPGALLALAILAAPMFLKALWYGPVYASTQSLVHPQSRATTSAIMLFIINVFGLGLGPLTIGMLSDHFALTLGEGPGLRLAMAVSSVAGLAAAGCFMMARRTMKAEIVS